MGMFDWFKSSYPLPEAFMVECQTKDIEDFGIGGSLSHFWLDPAGYLWVGNYTGTSTLEFIEEDDPRYSTEFKWANHKWVPTGEHGKWGVHTLTKYVEIYPSQWDGKWEDWPRLRLHFKAGKLQDWEEATGR
jgi:hypothetical protein